MAPIFQPAGGVFQGPLSIRIDPPGADTVVRFTLDGSEPGASSPAGDGTINLLRSTLVRARVFRNGQAAGPTVTQSYALAGTDIARFRGNLPVVVVNLFGQEVQHGTKRLASLSFLETKDGQTSLLGGESITVRGEVWWRGKSSLRYVKRSLGVKLRDDAGKSKAVSLLGWPEDSDWILYAPYPDKTLIRDVLAYDLSRQMGHYASRTRFVELFLNEGTGRLSMNHYMGVYVLEEKIKRAPERVKVQKLGTNDNAEPLVTGGYIIKKDHGPTFGEVEPTVDGRPNMGGGNAGSRYGYPTGPGGFPADPRGFLPPVGGEQAVMRTRPRRMERPPMAPGAPPPGQRIEREMILQGGRPVIIERQVERDGRMMVTRRGFTTGRGWESGIEEAFHTDEGQEFYYVEPKEDEITPAQKQWLRGYFNSFEKALYGPGFADPQRGYAAFIDVDSFIDYHLMVEVTKNIDGFRFSTYFQKDRGGRIKAQPIWDWNLSFGNANGKQGWMAEHWYWPQLDDQQYAYYRRLFEDPEFAQRYVDRWGVLRQTVFSTSNLMARIDAHVASLGEARIRNFARWPILGQMIWPNHYVGQTYEDEIQYLKDWTRKRLAWIDAQFTGTPVIRGSGTGGEVTLSVATALARIYFTTDGTDPRAPGGAPAKTSQPYIQPVAVKAGTTLTARAVIEERWSPPARFP